VSEKRINVARLWSRYGGGVPSRAPIILGLDREKYRTICIYLKKSSDEPNHFAGQGLKDYYISNKRFFRVFNIFAVVKLARILKREKIDILHCHKHQSVVYGALAAKIAGVPTVIAHVHGLNRSKAARRKFINRFVLRKVSRMVTVGQSVRDDVLAANPFLPADKVVSIGNSIDIERFANIDMSSTEAKERLGFGAESFVIGTVGRLDPTKGYDTLIAAFKKVKDRLGNAQLIFVGQGRLLGQLDELAMELELSDSVHFLGRRDDMPEVYRAMDVFVLPSIAEGMPRSLLEAMAVGVPCVASNVGGIPEILCDGEFGCQIEPGDADAISDAIIKLEDMVQEDKKTLISRAKQRVLGDYNHSVVIKRLEEIYQAEYTQND
jgi:glycosyltransferase involved in cell wall biosynthesis